MIAGSYKHSEESRKKMSIARTGRKHSEETKAKIGKAHKGRKWTEQHKINLRASMATEESRKKRSEIFKGRIVSGETRKKISEAAKRRKASDETREKISDSLRKRIGSKSTRWKGGVKRNQIPLYDTYAKQLEPMEEVRRDPSNENILQVKCTYCGKWIRPTTRSVNARLTALYNPKGNEECRFYCPGKSCRSQCSIYHRYKYPNGYKRATSREVQPELRKIVFQRDNYACQKCGSNNFIHCHHIDPVIQNPIESADVDNCITLCKTCHKAAHNLSGCSSNELKCGDRRGN